MTDPVVCADGNTYERSTIEAWFGTGNTTSPLTGVELESTSLIPNVLMRKVILSWRENEGAALVEAAKQGSNATNASSNGS